MISHNITSYEKSGERSVFLLLSHSISPATCACLDLTLTGFAEISLQSRGVFDDTSHMAKTDDVRATIACCFTDSMCPSVTTVLTITTRFYFDVSERAVAPGAIHGAFTDATTGSL